MKTLPLLITILISSYGNLIILAIYGIIKDMKRTDRIFEYIMRKTK
jgi:hypothetical protein